MSSTSTKRMRRHASLAFHDTRTVRVRATLRHGVIIPTRHALPLDGILASAARRDRLAANYGAIVDHHVEALPLTASLRSGVFSQHRWFWAASCATWTTMAQDLRHIHRRAWSEQEASSLGIVGDAVPANPEIGRWKAARIPHVVTVTDSLTWWALGDPRAIGALLDRVDSIGKKTGAGEGVVTAWDVVDSGPADWGRVLWHDAGTISRPIPVRHAVDLGLDSPETEMVDAYRPPYWRAARSETGRREAVEVIASWTQRPSTRT